MMPANQLFAAARQAVAFARHAACGNACAFSVGSRWFSAVATGFCSLQRNNTHHNDEIRACTTFPRTRFHTTAQRLDLMEFFDDPKNWGVKEVRSGRGWTKDDLRLKSNDDLHRLWFVLYKERNMLHTMKKEYERDCELFANPERIDKVEDSMKNLQAVVDERNKAAKLLEIGITGDAPKRTCYSGLSLRYTRTYQEHLMPYWRNPRHFAPRHIQPGPLYGRPRWFLLRYFEKLRRDKNKERRKQVAILKQSYNQYPDDPIWKDKVIEQMKLSDAFHSRMSD